MDSAQLLKKMCRQDLSAADIKAICKQRGFSAREAASRALFESFFLSDKGVASTLASLTPEEVTLLHLLKFTAGAVDITFFERLYGPRQSNTRYYGSFTQRYKDVFSNLKRSLVRKGLLLMAEAPVTSKKTKMERWRFRFPEEFEKFLPPLFSSVRTFETPGDLRRDILRKKLMEITRGKSSSSGRDKRYELTIADGQLRMGGLEFRAIDLLAWQRACWEASLQPEKKTRKRGEPQHPPIKLVTYAFSQLEPNQWILPDELTTLLNIFYNDAEHPSEQRICDRGWTWGCLEKHAADGKSYYRLPDSEDEADTHPGIYLRVEKDQSVAVDLETIPGDSLECLARISNLKIVNSQLRASPSLTSLGNALDQWQKHPLTVWLGEHSRAFRQAMKTVQKRWGKQIVHENLMLARIKDLRLKVKIEKSFPDGQKVLFLPNDFIAFPRAMFEDIEKLVKRSGHVIKTVPAE